MLTFLFEYTNWSFVSDFTYNSIVCLVYHEFFLKSFYLGNYSLLNILKALFFQLTVLILNLRILLIKIEWVIVKGMRSFVFCIIL